MTRPLSSDNNFLQPAQQPDYHVRRRRHWGKIFIIISLVAAIVAAASTAYQLAAPSSDPLASLLRHVPVVRQVAQWIRPGLSVANTDTIYLALGGISGVGHDGPLLTDTIMLVVLKPRTGNFGLVSIPRDLAVATSAGAFQKVNSVYALAEASKPGSGVAEFKKTLGVITGAPITYAAIINFRGFEQLIDTFGGVTVDVPNGFTDYNYPDGKGGAKTVSFTAGRQQMNGVTALEYTRSRHGNNNEGSDFARARRQQTIMVSLAHEVLQLRTLTSPRRLNAIANLLKDYINTDLDVGTAVDLALQFQATDPAAAPHLVIDDSPNGFLNNAIGPDGAFLLTPRGGSFANIQSAIADLFNPNSVVANVTVEVQNGTSIAGLAQTIADRLAAEQFIVPKFGNAGRTDVARTVIYDYSNGADPLARSRLAELFPTSLILPGTATSSATFILLIGRDLAGGV